MANKVSNKSEILFLYETSYNIPNGDPFTGEQRYDEETKKILVSDVRIKRFIRTFLEENGHSVFVSKRSGAGETDGKGVIEYLVKQKYNEHPNDLVDVESILKEHEDVRLFGGISTLKIENDGSSIVSDIKEDEKGEGKEVKIKCKNGHIQLTGPVQFAQLNPSLNRVNMRMHQNTSHFKSDSGKSQGAIATTTIVPYSIVQIHGWINPKVAETTGMTDEDKSLMLKSMWYGTSGEGSSFSRSKIGQQSLLLLELVYKADTNKQVYGVDRLIAIKPKDGKKEEQLRSMDDFELDFTKLQNVLLKTDSPIDHIEYYTNIDGLAKKLWSQTVEKTEKGKSEMGQVENENLKSKFKVIEEL